jgi:hypothetical protein
LNFEVSFELDLFKLIAIFMGAGEKNLFWNASNSGSVGVLIFLRPFSAEDHGS